MLEKILLINFTLLSLLILFDDVTRVKHLEQMRQDFVSNVSHELRTPVTSIKGASETLIEGALDNPADARRFSDIIFRQSERLSRIIEDLLSLSKIEKESDSNFVEFAEQDLYSIILCILHRLSHPLSLLLSPAVSLN